MTHGKDIGRVLWFDSKKGYGFLVLVSGEKKDVFFHFSEIRTEDRYKKVFPGEYVSLDVVDTGNEGRRWTGSNITGVLGGPLLVDDPDNIHKVIKKRESNDSREGMVSADTETNQEDTETNQEDSETHQ